MSEEKTAPPIADWMQPGARYTMSIEPAIAMRTAAFDWDYEIQVALPASYGVTPDKRYPVLWLTDGPLMFHLAVGLLNVLVVGACIDVGQSFALLGAEEMRMRITAFEAPAGGAIANDDR